MPFTLNGCGTSVCPSRGSVAWSKGKWYSSSAHDYDALECLVFLFLPIIPFRVVHTFDWDGRNYRRIPLKWSATVVFRAMMRRWLMGAFLVGGIVTFAGIFDSDLGWWAFWATGLLMVAISVGGLYWMHASDEKTRSIRRLLGRHSHGSSDPASWHPTLLPTVRKSKELYGTDSFASAVGSLLKGGQWSNAMWAARLSVAFEDKTVGERLTDEVLADTQVKVALQKIRDDPSRWRDILTASNPAIS